MIRRVVSVTILLGALTVAGAGSVLAHDEQGTQGTDNPRRAIADPFDQAFIVGNIEAGAFAHDAGGKVIAAQTHNPTCGLHVHAD